LIAAALFLVAWLDSRTAASLRERGAVTVGRVVGSETLVSDSNSGRTDMMLVRTWAYQVGGRSYELKDRGSSYVPIADAIARLGPAAPDQIVYLPEDPSVARMRDEIGPNVFGPLVGGSLFLVIAAALGGVGIFLLPPSGD
jgi:hypothetical protein